jgi:hypothetical protein
MADTNVHLTGSEDGAFTNALSELPPWATENTALLIESHLRKSLDTQAKTLAQILKDSGGVKGQSPAQQKALNDQLDQYIKSLKDANAAAAKQRQQDEKDKKAAAERDVRNKKDQFVQRSMTKMLTSLVSIGTRVFSVQKQYFETSEGLFKSGVNLLNGQNETSSSMEALNQMITLTGLRLETFQKVVEKYTSSINAIGINKFAKTLSLTNQRMQLLGYNSQEQAELLGALVEMESSYADIRNKSTTELASDAVRLGTQLNKLSLTTGLSNTQLQENLKALAKNSDSMVVSAIYGERAAENMNLLAASAKDTDIAGMFQKIATAVIPEITGPFKALNSAGLGQQATQLTRIIQASRDGAISASQAMEQATLVAKGMNSAQIQALKIQEQAGTEGAAEAITVIAKLRAQNNTLSQATEKQTAKAIDNQAVLSSFSTEIERARAQVEKSFPLLESQVEMATDKLRLFNNALDSVTESISKTTRSQIALGLEILGGVAIVALGISKLTGGFGGLATVASAAKDAIATGARGVVATLSPLALGLATVAAGAFAAYEVFNLIKAFSGLRDAKDHLKESQKTKEDVNSRIANLSPEERARFDAIDTSFKSKNTTISVPKNPMPSTVVSPSAVPATQTKVTTDPVTGEKQTTVVSNPENERLPKNGDINSLLAYQNSLSEQVLQGIIKLVSVNSDILKHTRIN